jgi:hypothetical protein
MVRAATLVQQCQPYLIGIASHVALQEPPPVVGDDEEARQDAEGQGIGVGVRHGSLCSAEVSVRFVWARSRYQRTPGEAESGMALTGRKAVKPSVAQGRFSGSGAG